eukprot:TRINITY_DN3889_c0_g1_i1.p1 TRINITY_DN3889_c0_g1~~TRINITY_DN3889_c0_g1_i1.p1  ORF type:complete len:729 (+),score=92.09 TRINITY_DN3889_c0_g1_i1:78-2264(+)
MSLAQSATLRTSPVPLLKTHFSDIEPWLVAAQSFELNTDFDFSTGCSAGHGKLDLPALRKLMREESAGKRTIQVLSDKFLLHGLLQNLGVPQMPLLLSLRGDEPRLSTCKQEIERLVRDHLSEREKENVVMKPTHLSSGSGVVVISQVAPEYHEATVNFLDHHVKRYIAETAHADESAALRSLRPGFIAQPEYQSVVRFETPLELRVVTLWGKARLGIWWWGNAKKGNQHAGRNAWFVRRPASAGKLSDSDTWEVVHEHVGTNVGFDCALELFHRHMSAMGVAAEKVARAVGAPFLRCDFFVGCPKWGIRLNEVAYGCGADYRTSLHHLANDRGTQAPSLKGTQCRVLSRNSIDDSGAVARILQEGMSRCEVKRAPDFFLERLGVCGHTYSDTVVFEKLHPEISQPFGKRRNASSGDESTGLSLDGRTDHRCCLESLHSGINDGGGALLAQDEDLAVPEALCRTVSTARASLSKSGDHRRAILSPSPTRSLARTSAFVIGDVGNGKQCTESGTSRPIACGGHAPRQARPHQQQAQQSPRMPLRKLQLQQDTSQRKQIKPQSPPLVCPRQQRNQVMPSKPSALPLAQHSKFASWQPFPAKQQQIPSQLQGGSVVVRPHAQSTSHSKVSVDTFQPLSGQRRMSRLFSVATAEPVGRGRLDVKHIPVHVPAALSASAPWGRQLFDQSSYSRAVSPDSCGFSAPCTAVFSPAPRVPCQAVIHPAPKFCRISC